MGSHHDKPKCPRCARARRPRARICLRKGCGRKYQPRRWNQRYCQEPDCQRKVRRWQAAQRQARCRQDAAAKARQAEAQRLRRQRARSASQPPKNSADTAARGHAAEVFFRLLCAPGPGAMNHRKSRSATRRATAAPACRQAVHQVLDRERKWQSRDTLNGRRKRAYEYRTARAQRSRLQRDASGAAPSEPPPR